MDTSRDDLAESISEAHLLYMRKYVRYEDERSRKTVEQFLAERLPDSSHSKPPES
jgi:hypothetical protein